MKSSASSLSLVVSTSALAAVVFMGCAEGATNVDPAEAYLSATPADAGANTTDEQDAASVKIPAPSNPPADEDESDAEAPAADAGADSGAPDAGNTGGVSCTAPNACNAAVDLGSVSGDTGSDVKTAQGHTSKWFTVRVTEDDDGIMALQLWMTATLKSPAGTNFDLFLYVPSSDTRECSAVSLQSTNATGDDTATAKWGESNLLTNGADDARTITVEVRHVSGTCDPSKQWSLTLAGNK